MATAIQAVIADNSTDANFRAWITAIHTQIQAMGLVNTADTGQVDHTTVTRPLTTNTPMGYKMYRFNDALQATAPIFVKIEFGSGGVQSYPSVWVTVGKATDGAGNFVGSEKSTRIQNDVISSGAAATFNCVFSGAANRFGCLMWNDASSSALWFMIERSKDGLGVDTNEGIIIAQGHRGGTASAPAAWQQFVPMSGGPPALETRIQAITATGSSAAFGLTVGIGVPIPLAGAAKNPGVGLLMYNSGDFAADITVSVAMYGTARTYYTAGGNLPFHNQVSAGRIMILYQ